MTARQDRPRPLQPWSVAPVAPEPRRRATDNRDPAPLPDVSSNLKASWAGACRRLRAELGDAVFTSWFARLELDGFADGTAYLSVPTTFLRTWIQSHYAGKLQTVLSAEASDVTRIVIGLRATGRTARLAPVSADALQEARSASEDDTSEVKVAPLRPEMPAREPATAVDNLVGSPLDRRLTLASFLTGKSNQLAFAAATQVADARAGTPPLYSPLYVHAAVGLGKTHLLQSVAHAAIAAERRVIYLTAERFMYGFVASLKAQTALAFKERLRAIDLLVIDDVQFLQGKTIQQEFCHTLNALIDDGRQVVVAADRPPGELDQLEERVRSRLAGGLCVGMEPLDEALRIAFLENRIASIRAHQPGFDLSPAVIAYVARAIVTNGRDLDGAMNRLMAHATLNSASHTVESAEAAIRDLIRAREPKKVKIEDIQKLVASHYNVTRADLLSSRRTAAVVRPRQIAMYLSKSLTLRSLPEIGRRFGGRDHTTVLHAVRKIEALSSQEAGLAEDLELLKRMLQD